MNDNVLEKAEVFQTLEEMVNLTNMHRETEYVKMVHNRLKLVSSSLDEIRENLARVENKQKQLQAMVDKVEESRVVYTADEEKLGEAWLF